MSIQGRHTHNHIPEEPPLSSVVINRGNEEYDPFNIDDEDHESEQLTKTQKPETIQINNGKAMNPVIINANQSSSSIQSQSTQMGEQRQSQCKNKSPTEHNTATNNNNNHSEQRAKSSSYRNHNSSDRKRLHSSSPDPSNRTTVNTKESSNDEQISLRHKKTRNDERKKTKHYYKNRSSSRSPSPPSPLSKSPSPSPSPSNHSNRVATRSDKRYHDYNSYKHNSSSRSYHSYSSSKYSSRDNPSLPSTNRRTNISSLPALQSKIVVTDGKSSLSNVESNNHETSTEDRNRIYNRLTAVNDTNTTILPLNNTNKIPSATTPTFVNTNGGTQRSRSNLIQIVTTEAASVSSSSPSSTQAPLSRSSSSQVKSQSNKPQTLSSTITKVASTVNTKDSTLSTVSSKTNGNTADDILMEEMLLEEQEQCPLKTIDLDSLTIPESSNPNSANKDNSSNGEPLPTSATTTTIANTTTMTTTVTTTIATPTTTTTASTSSVSTSQTKKPYTLYKVQHVNHMTPPLSSRHKKQNTKEPTSTLESDSTTNKPSIDDAVRRPSLDERLLNVFGTSSTKPNNSSTEKQNGTQPNPPIQSAPPSDKSQDYLNLVKRLNTNDERRSQTSKEYTSEWLASQKPEEAPTEELVVLPTTIVMPPATTLTQPPTANTNPTTANVGEKAMFGKLTAAISKLIQKNPDTNGPSTTTTTATTTITTTTTETDDSVPISAKHLERLQRRKEREERQGKIAAIAKEVLKPAFRNHDINKDEYKEIMKKVVTKTTNANEVDRIRISNMVTAYIEKYRAIRQHNAAKMTSNGNAIQSR